eukprot:2866372-Amphidinium_carterae.1
MRGCLSCINWQATRLLADDTGQCIGHTWRLIGAILRLMINAKMRKTSVLRLVSHLRLFSQKPFCSSNKATQAYAPKFPIAEWDFKPFVLYKAPKDPAGGDVGGLLLYPVYKGAIACTMGAESRKQEPT